MDKGKYDTIIVGAGIAGLTAAAYLARAGQKVLLLEKNNECGGLVSSFSHNGFHFEAGVRALEDAGIIFPMLKDLGIDLPAVRSKVSVGIGKEVIHIENLESLKEYENMLSKLFPENADETKHLIKIFRTIMKHMDVLYGIENPMFKNLKRDKSYLFKKLLPWLPKFIFTIGKINRMNGPVEDYLRPIISNPALRDMISQHFFKSTPTFFALSYFSLYLDYFYPIGGVGKLANAVQKKVEELGVEIKTETTIVSVHANQHYVIDEKQKRYNYANLIWAADLKTFYKQTELTHLKPKVTKTFKQAKEQAYQSRGSDSIFSLYLEVDEPLETFQKIAHGHFFYTPSHKGLGETHRSELQTLLDNWNHSNKEEVLQWLRKFTRLNTYEISIPGLKDSNLVPKGKTAIIISVLAEYNLFKKVRDSGWLDAFKLHLENYIIEEISNSIYPNLDTKIQHRFSFNPLSIESRVGSSEGSIIGWTFEKPIPAINKIQSSARSVLTPIPNIYKAGQWAYSPAGVPMCILTGKLAADRILKK